MHDCKSRCIAVAFQTHGFLYRRLTASQHSSLPQPLQANQHPQNAKAASYQEKADNEHVSSTSHSAICQLCLDMSPTTDFVHSAKQPSLVLTYSKYVMPVSKHCAASHPLSRSNNIPATNSTAKCLAAQGANVRAIDHDPNKRSLLLWSCFSCYNSLQLQATVLSPYAHQAKVKNYLSTEPIQLPSTVQRLLFGVQTMAVMAISALLAAGLLQSYMRSEIDDLFCLPAALMFLLLCTQIIFDQPTLDNIGHDSWGCCLASIAWSASSDAACYSLYT